MPRRETFQQLQRTNQRTAAGIIEHIRLRKAGLIDRQPWAVFKLVGGEFEQLLSALKANESLWGFFEEKVRYVVAHMFRTLLICFVLRMPTSIYEAFMCQVVCDIILQLEKIGIEIGTSAVAEFAKHIKYLGSLTMKFPTEYANKGNGRLQRQG